MQLEDCVCNINNNKQTNKQTSLYYSHYSRTAQVGLCEICQESVIHCHYSSLIFSIYYEPPVSLSVYVDS